jgi:hypothetical protein
VRLRRRYPRAGECFPPVVASLPRSPPLWRASPPPRFARLPLPIGSVGREGLRRWVTRSVIHGRLAPWNFQTKTKSAQLQKKSGCQPQRGGDVRFLRVLFPQTPDSRQQGESVIRTTNFAFHCAAFWSGFARHISAASPLIFMSLNFPEGAHEQFAKHNCVVSPQ